jgi:serine O-acetyltransferase
MSSPFFSGHRMSLQDRLLVATRVPVVGKLAYAALKLLGVEFPRSVEWSSPLQLAHGSVGLVVHRATRIGARVTILPGVVIGMADAHMPPGSIPEGGRVVIGDDVTLGAGAKVLFRGGEELVLGDGTVVGANAVLLNSTAAGEIWAGVPARRVGVRSAAPVTTPRA